MKRSMLLGLMFSTTVATAANRIVTSLNDNGPGTLREAITLVGIGETISFAVTGTIELTTGNLLVTDHVTIIGPGASSLTVTRRSDAPSSFQIFRVSGGANVVISGLSITKGLSLFEDNDRTGGAIGLSTATLALENCAITDNQGFDGGGITNKDGTLTIRNCLFARNRSVHGQSASNGGGILGDGGTTIVENSTFFDNIAQSGGGIEQSRGTLTVTHCTFSNNRTFTVPTLRPGNCILVGSGAVLTIANTILQARDGDPALSTPSATVVSNGYNLCSDAAGGLLTGPGDQVSTDAKLDPAGAQHNGGPTQTIALLSESLALDKGKAFGLTTDQRGQTRPRDLAAVGNASGGDGSDIGAFEAIDLEQDGPALLVTTTDDHDDGLAGANDCTLREAINRANAMEGTQTITFGANVAGTILLQSLLGTLQVTEGIVIDGPGARTLALSGEGGVRPVLSFASGSSGSAVSGLTVRNGQRPGAFVDGAGLVNVGKLTVVNCAFTSNAATGFDGTQPGQAGGRARGGAVFNDGTLTLDRCSFSGNAARGGKGANIATQFGRGGNGGSAEGGAVFNSSAAALVITNCTFSSNSGLGGAGGNNTNFGGGSGGNGNGGVFNQGMMSMTACTLVGNTGAGGMGGLGNSQINNGVNGAGRGGLTADTGTSAVSNTLCAGNAGIAGPDVFGAFVSGGYSLIGKNNGSTGFTAGGDQAGTSAIPLDPQVGSFQNNGGPTDTLLPLSTSPALDKGRAFFLATDQRRVSRTFDSLTNTNAPGGDGTDIGAAEVQPSYSGPLRVISTSFVGPTLHVLLQGMAGVNYQLQTSETLVMPSALFGNPQIADSLGLVEFIVYGPLPTRLFYRGVQAP